jgi:phosphatidylserine decarboxylase
MRFIPGSLFSVSTGTAQHIDQLFARNERVVSFFDTELGPMAIVMVGAMLVSSMAIRWAGIVGSKTGKIEEFDYSQSDSPIVLNKGEELGYFNMGSTVIILMGESLAHLYWDTAIHENSDIQMGQLLAHC